VQAGQLIVDSNRTADNKDGWTRGWVHCLQLNKEEIWIIAWVIEKLPEIENRGTPGNYKSYVAEDDWTNLVAAGPGEEKPIGRYNWKCLRSERQHGGAIAIDSCLDPSLGDSDPGNIGTQNSIEASRSDKVCVDPKIGVKNCVEIGV
jgi:hypothetical protein